MVFFYEGGILRRALTGTAIIVRLEQAVSSVRFSQTQASEGDTEACYGGGH
jgi:hypothetical protein